MDELIKKRIFEFFYIIKEVGKGIGFGFFISYGIVEYYCGRIEVESEIGKGVIFILIFLIVLV